MRRRIGTVLILIATFILTIIYYPLISVYFGSAPEIPVSLKGDYIYIPKIKAQALIIKDVNPWIEKDYKDALKKGVAKAKGFNNFYFAHSSLPPWEMTRTNIPFLRLGELTIGDQIIISENNVKKTYVVAGSQEVWPWQVSAIKNHDNEIILQTCTPIGTDLKRLLVFARNHP